VDAQTDATPTIQEMRPETPLSPEENAAAERRERERAEEQRRAEQARARQRLAEKLHFWVFGVFERVAKGQAGPALNEAKFVSDGKAILEIRLAAKTPEAIEKLKNAGFEIAREDGTKITGKAPVDKLSKLAEIAEVRYIFPGLK
jgi:hypothetical protein